MLGSEERVRGPGWSGDRGEGRVEAADGAVGDSGGKCIGERQQSKQALRLARPGLALGVEPARSPSLRYKAYGCDSHAVVGR